MTQPDHRQSNPWLQLGLEAKALALKELPEVQQSLRRMERKIYPETARALREQEEQQP